MGIGILQKEEAIVAEVKEVDGSIAVERSFTADTATAYKNAIVGLPLEKFIIKNLYLPNVTKKELPKAIELQLEFNIPDYNKADFNTNCTAKEYKAGYILQIVAIRKSLYDKRLRTIVPSLLSLYAYADEMNLLAKGANTLLVHIDNEQCSIVTIKNEEIVFMRSLPLTQIDNFDSIIKLSSQAVFLQTERQFIDINKIVVFADSEEHKKRIGSNLEGEKEVAWVNTSEYTLKEPGDLFIPVGLGLAKKHNKAVKSWAISEKPPEARDLIRRLLIYLIPIVIIFVPLYYYAEYFSKKTEINGLQRKIDSLSSQMGDLAGLESRASQENAYMNTIGNPALNMARINELFNVINLCRSKNLWVTSLSGKVDDVIIISGFAQSYEDITGFIKNLESSDFIKNINLNYTTESSGQNVGFQMSFQLDKGYGFILKSSEPQKKKSIEPQPTKSLEPKDKKNSENNATAHGNAVTTAHGNNVAAHGNA